MLQFLLVCLLILGLTLIVCAPMILWALFIRPGVPGGCNCPSCYDRDNPYTTPWEKEASTKPDRSV